MIQPTSYIKVEHANPKHADYVVINWCLGTTCNFSCSYCPETLHDAAIEWPSLEQMKAATQRMINHYAPKKIYFEFTGGEVTLWKELLDLCKYLKNQGCRVGIISNASRSLDFWANAKPSLDHICCSFHSEKGDAEHFLKVVEFLSADISVHVNIMMLPEKFDFLTDFANRISQVKNISLALQTLLKNFSSESYPYTPEQKNILNQQRRLFKSKIIHDKPYEHYRGAMAQVDALGNKVALSNHQFISLGKNNWEGWNCYAGVEQIVVGLDGHAYRGWCHVGGSLGSVFNEQTHYPKTPVTCTRNFCHCNFDIMTTKEKAAAP